MARQQSVSQWERSGTGELAATAAAAGSNFDSSSRSYNSTKEWNFDNIDERQEKRVYDAVFESTCEFGDLMQETRIAVDMFSKTIEQQQVNVYVYYFSSFLFVLFLLIVIISVVFFFLKVLIKNLSHTHTLSLSLCFQLKN
jgi:hypothetical protein